MPDPFATGLIVTVLAWLATAGGLLFSTLALFAFIAAKDGVSRLFKLWLVLCIALLTPARYIFFQLVAGAAFPFQSFSAFINSLLLILYVPIVFGILYLIAIGIPLSITNLVLGDDERRDAGRYIGATVVLPIVCVVAYWLFQLALPLGARSVRWLPAEQVIKATNGPAAFVFDHVARPFSPIAVPKYFELTPRDAKALRRCHAATLYLSEEEQTRFVAVAYPKAYEALTAP